MTDEEVFKMSFNIDRHKSQFVNYCEVVIYPDGKVEYAVPSHIEKMYEVYVKNHKIAKEKAKEMFYNNPNFFDILLEDTGLVLVWFEQIIYKKITNTQKIIIDLLQNTRCIDLKNLL